MDEPIADFPVPAGVGSEGVAATPPSSTQGQPSGFSPAGAQPSPPAERQIPYERFREVAEGQRRAREEAATYRAEVEQWKARAHALAGLNQPAAADPAETEIRAAMERLYPGIGALLAQREQLEQLAEAAPSFQRDIAQREQAHYDRVADSAIGQLFQVAAATFGGQLGEPQKAQIHKAFYGFIATDPEVYARYSRSDPTLVPEFWQAYTAAVLDPIRRTAAVALGARGQRAAGLPTAGHTSGPVGVGVAPLPEDHDALLEAAWRSLKRA